MKSSSSAAISCDRLTAPAPPWAGLAVLLLAGFVTIFDLFVVNVAIPSIQSGLGPASRKSALSSQATSWPLACC